MKCEIKIGLRMIGHSGLTTYVELESAHSRKMTHVVDLLKVLSVAASKQKVWPVLTKKEIGWIKLRVPDCLANIVKTQVFS